MTNDDYQSSEAFKRLQEAQTAWKRYCDAPSAESRTEFNRLHEAALQEAEQYDPLIAEHDICRVIPMADPTLRRLLKEPPAGFPSPVKSDAGVSYYSAKALQRWKDLRVKEVYKIIEPDLKNPPPLASQAKILRNGQWKTPQTPQEICAAKIEEAMADMVREIEGYFEHERMDSADQRKSIKRLRAEMIKVKKALEVEIPQKLRRQLALRENFTPELAARVIKKCDERLEKPVRSNRPHPDAFEKEIAGRWARQLLKIFHPKKTIGARKVASLTAILYGNP